jgi:hypothetical protein
MIQETVKDRLHAARGLGTNDVLAALGLERRRTPIDVVIPAAGLFFAGLMVGAGVALLMAPKSGRETRREIRGRATNLRHRLTTSASGFAHDLRDELVGTDEPRSERLPDNGGKAREIHRPAPPHGPNPNSGPQK